MIGFRREIVTERIIVEAYGETRKDGRTGWEVFENDGGENGGEGEKGMAKKGRGEPRGMDL